MSVRTIDGALLKQMFLHAAAVLDENKETVNALNVFPVPDGDTGSNMSMTMTSAAREVERARGQTVGEVAAAIAQGSLMGARGNSGVILSQLFRGFARHCDGVSTLDARELANALQAGVDTAYKAVMKPVEGTILTVARESASAAATAAKKLKEIGEVLRVTLEAAELALSKTPELLPVLKKAGVVDSGGKGLVLILRGYLEVVQGRPVEEGAARPAPAPVAAPPVRQERHDVSPAGKIAFKVDEEISHIEFPYDTELFIRRYQGGPPIPHEQVQEVLDTMGDSVYVVGDENLAKVHIHAKNPGPVLDYCIKYGDLIDIVIHNMREQHEDLLAHAQREEAPAPGPEPEPEDAEDAVSAVVAVGVGAGIEEIFRSIGVAHVIQGGQTMNPSTQDLLDAINRCATSEVFVLPNNKNIILAAEQAATLTEKKVHVIPTRSVPQGIAAMLKWTPDEDPSRAAREMMRALEEVQTGEITFSVRDTTFGEIEIQEGDILGLWNGQIRATGTSPEQVLKQVLADMAAEKGGDVITVYWGEGIDEERAEELGEELRAAYPDRDVEVLQGGQPLYFYIFSLE